MLLSDLLLASRQDSFYLHVFVPDGHEYAVESLVFAANVELGENHHVLGVDGSVGDPVFLGKRVWGVHDEL